MSQRPAERPGVLGPIAALLPALTVGAVVTVIAVLGYQAVAPPRPPCLAKPLAERLGKHHLWIGGSMSDFAFRQAPFDLRYAYLAGGAPDGACEDCRTCAIGGAPCRNPIPCAWWGCWQDEALPPGRYVVDFVRTTAATGALPMLSWYQWLTLSGGEEGAAEIAAFQDAPRVARWVADWTVLMGVLSEATEGPVIVHLEPDLLAFAQKEAPTPDAVPVALPPACAGYAPTLAGVHRCLIAIARQEAPHVLIASHASSWGAGPDAYLQSDPAFDLVAHAERTAAFVAAAGAGDLVVVETSHRDAGFDGRWWDPTDATAPNFAMALAWARAVSRSLGLAHLWWQVPYGHPGLPDSCGRYRDNRVDHVFDHPGAWADDTTLGVAFGAGAECMTGPETDGGHFLRRAATWFAGERPPLCAP